MITDFFIVVMTRHLKNQLEFYQDFLGLELIFNHDNTSGLGKNGHLFVILRQDNSEKSHHKAEQKGPVIITFKSQGDPEHYIELVKNSKFVYRDIITVPELDSQYLFIEDADGNEVCLDFKRNA